MFEDGLAVFYPNGEQFKEPREFIQERDQARQERERAQQEREKAQQEREKAQQERDRAFAKLRELGVDPNQL